MSKLTNHEREALLRSASEIYTNKWLLSIAYKALSNQASDEITENLLTVMHTNEVNDAARGRYAAPLCKYTGVHQRRLPVAIG